jgi:hypothetical protein
MLQYSKNFTKQGNGISQSFVKIPLLRAHFRENIKCIMLQHEPMDDLPGSDGGARGTLGSQPGGPAGGDSSARWAYPCTLRSEDCLITIFIRLS